MNYLVPTDYSLSLLRPKIKKALQAITGNTDIIAPKAIIVEQVVGVVPSYVAERILTRAIDNYDGAKTYPTKPFWKKCKFEVLSAIRSEDAIKSAIRGDTAYTKPTDLETQTVIKKAAELAMRYSPKTGISNPIADPVNTRKLKMIKHLEDNEVLITDPNDKDFDRWIDKDTAVANNSDFYEPKHYSRAEERF